MRDFVDFVKVIGAVLCFTIIIITIVILLSMWLNSAICHSRWGAVGLETDWGPLQGCIIRTQYGRIPQEKFNQVEILNLRGIKLY